MSYDWFIPWFPVLVIGSYIPQLVLMDIRNREVPHKTWIGILPAVVLTAYLYATGFYMPEMLVLSLVAVAVFFAVMKLGVYEGADFMFLMFISLLFVVNPISGRVLMPIVLAEFLVAVFVSVNVVAFVIRKKYERFPMVPVIASAFILAVILG